MAKTRDLTGERVGRLTVIKRVQTKDKHSAWWLCKCDCGNEKLVRSTHLMREEVRSCGCLFIDTISKTASTHGMTGTRLYNIWCGIIERCYTPKSTNYKHYGGRGIVVCDEWRYFEPFCEWAFANGYKDSLTIDRIDVNGNYEPSNCRWSDYKTQARNRTNTKLIGYRDENKTMAEWCELLGLNYKVVSQRIRKLHWSVEKSFETPVKIKRRKAERELFLS